MSVKKQALIDTAARLFATEGYHAVGVDRIAEESGVAKMTMYNHFSSKEALVFEVLLQSMEQAQQSLEQWVMKKSGAMQRLQAVFAWQARVLKTPGHQSTLFIGAISEYHAERNEIMDIATTQKQRLRGFIADLLIELFDSETATRLARQIVMLLDGAIIARQVGDTKAIEEDAWKATQRLVALELASSTLNIPV